MAITKRRTTRKTTKKGKRSTKRTTKRTTKRSLKANPKSAQIAKLLAYIKKMSKKRCANGHKRKVVKRQLCVQPAKLQKTKKMLRGRGIRGPMVVLTTGAGRKCIHYVASGCKH